MSAPETEAEQAPEFPDGQPGGRALPGQDGETRGQRKERLGAVQHTVETLAQVDVVHDLDGDDWRRYGRRWALGLGRTDVAWIESSGYTDEELMDRWAPLFSHEEDGTDWGKFFGLDDC